MSRRWTPACLDLAAIAIPHTVEFAVTRPGSDRLPAVQGRLAQFLASSAAAAATALAAAGCAGGSGRSPAVTDPDAPLPANPAALLPARLVIHPLTALTARNSGTPVLVAHLELLDRFEQNTRALGRLRLRVLRPGRIEPDLDVPHAGTAGATWLIDLTDPDRNAVYYDDLVTRTYTITLSDLPDWLADWAAQRDQSTSPPMLAAEFTFADQDGRARALRDTMSLSR